VPLLLEHVTLDNRARIDHSKLLVNDHASVRAVRVDRQCRTTLQQRPVQLALFLPFRLMGQNEGEGVARWRGAGFAFFATKGRLWEITMRLLALFKMSMAGAMALGTAVNAAPIVTAVSFLTDHYAPNSVPGFERSTVTNQTQWNVTLISTDPSSLVTVLASHPSFSTFSLFYAGDPTSRTTYSVGIRSCSHLKDCLRSPGIQFHGLSWRLTRRDLRRASFR